MSCQKHHILFDVSTITYFIISFLSHLQINPFNSLMCCAYMYYFFILHGYNIFLCFSFVCGCLRTAPQWGVWKTQHHKAGSCHEGWKLRSDRKVQKLIGFKRKFLTFTNIHILRLKIVFSSYFLHAACVAASRSWCTWPRNIHHQWQITGIQLTCSSELVSMNTWPGSTQTPDLLE